MKKQLLGIFLILMAVIIVANSAAALETASETVAVINVTVSPESVKVGENVTVIATVKNTGNITENTTVVFKMNGKEVKSFNITIEANTTETVEYVVSKDAPGIYNTSVDGVSASFMVIAQLTPTPSPTPVPSPTPSPTPTLPLTSPPTPAPGKEKFRVGPVVRLRPVVDVIERGRDGIIEVYIDNPSLNDVELRMEVHVSVPSGLHIYTEQYAWATAAGVAYAPLIEIPPGTARTLALHIKADKRARIGTHTLHFSGLYYPGNNKDLYNPVSLTYPVNVKEASIKAPTPTPGETPTPKPPGFEALFAIAGSLIAYLVWRRK